MSPRPDSEWRAFEIEKQYVPCPTILRAAEPETPRTIRPKVSAIEHTIHLLRADYYSDRPTLRASVCFLSAP